MEKKKENSKKETKDTQSRCYAICLHNIKETGFNHQKIKETLHGIPSLKYYCIADEIGLETKKLHTHLYFSAVNPLKFSTVCNKFKEADFHVDSCLGSAQANRDYVFKTGKWEGDPKADQRLPDTQEEWGELPVSRQGHRSDLERMYALVKAGLTDTEILEACGETAIKYVDKIAKLRHTYLVDKFTGERRLDLKVHYVTGQTGTGKTRDILDEHGDRNVYRVTDYQHPFDSYQCQPVLVFEEFRASLRLSDMLNYLDIYPAVLPARYSPRVGCYLTVYVVSNWTFEQQYSEIQKDPGQKSTYEAWIRRFNGMVKEYTGDEIIVYPSIQDYLTREQHFHKVYGKTPFTASNTTIQAHKSVKKDENEFTPDGEDEPLPWEK